MAARSNDQEEEEIWGTWEELILACLVKRYGPHSWDTVALEIRSRFPSAHRLTPDTCRSRYQLLRSRFGDRDLVGDDDDTSNIPWLDELRNLRVAELRKEVQRHDEFIGSLQQKVKKLKEEREIGSRSDTKEEQKERKEIVGDGISVEDSGRSCNESNNTERKEEPEKKMEAQVKENTNTVINVSRSGSVNTNPNRNENESSSDVQSLARRRRKLGVQRSSLVTSVGKEREEAEFESQPLIAFLESIQSSQDGLVFKNRLQSQESELYKSMIRRHMDLEIIRNCIGTNGYSRSEFFRDLLLLCNNAVVFYPKNSAESISALRLRNQIQKEISAKLHKTPQPSPKSQKGQQTPSPQISSQSKPEPVPFEKPAKVAPLVACRKRSSVSEKPIKHVKKVEKVEEEEEVMDRKSVKSRGPRTSKARASGSVTKKPSPLVNPKPEMVEQEVKTGSTKQRGMNFLSRIKSSPPSAAYKEKNEDMKKETERVAKRKMGRPPKRGGKREREEKLTSSPKKRGRR